MDTNYNDKEAYVQYDKVEYEVERPIVTYYFDHNNKLIKNTSSKHVNSAVSICTTNMRTDYYEGAVSAQVFDCTTARLYAHLIKKRNGKLEIDDFVDPRGEYDTVHRKQLAPRTMMALIPIDELRR